jgi:hypothetical protein
MPNIGRGRGVFSGDGYSYKASIEGKEITALWQVPLKENTLRYYVRSEPDKGITKVASENKYKYSVGVALGPYLLAEDIAANRSINFH